MICPWCSDQPFGGHRVQALGAGPAAIPPRNVTSTRLAAAIREAVGNPALRATA